MAFAYHYSIIIFIHFLAYVYGDAAVKNGAMYEALLYDTEFELESTTGLEKYKSICGLGVKQTSLNLFEDPEMQSDAWPFVAGLYKVGLGRTGTKPKMLVDSSPSCTATIISSTHLLTAASCVREFIYQLPPEVSERQWIRIFNFTTLQYLVRFVNSSSSTSTDLQAGDNMVEEIMFYPCEMDEPFHNIAILKLVNPLNFNSTFAPVCVPRGEYELIEGTECFAVRWMSDEVISYEITNRPPDTEFKFLSKKDCKKIDSFHEKFHFCLSGKREEDSETSEHGAGLFCKLAPDSQKWYIFGIGASSDHKGREVYSAVPVYSKWIYENAREPIYN